MEGWHALLAVYCAVFFMTWPSVIRGEECTLDGVRGVLVPGEQCDLFWEKTMNELDNNSVNANESAIVCCPVFQSEPNCGKVSQYDGTFSHDSRETQLDQFPWAVVISYRWFSKTVCSGSLITREFVLSAAHCYSQPRKALLPTQYRVRLGDWDLNIDKDCQYVDGAQVCNEYPPVEIPVRTIVNHRLYEPKRRDFLHDIALLRLARPVEYGALISPVCMPSWSRQVPQEIVGQDFTATGWGKTHAFMALQRKLKIGMSGLNMTVCMRAYKMTAPEVPQVQLCIGGKRRRDVCYGDSGGALMRRENDLSRWTQVGIISFGANHCDQGFPGVYTNVAFYLDWIQRVIQDATGVASGA
uniref:Peptidase S1 domain-containing protein n=1 Tax=Anopheles atroparvus TaxID=41427 RepID=A0AAG5CW86_ANOAO